MTGLRRAVLPEDLDGVARLLRIVEMADGHHPIGEHQYLELAAGSEGEVVGLLMEAEGAPVAYAGLTRVFVPSWWTLELAVHPAWRTAEVFGTLLEAAVTEATNLGGAFLRLWALLPHLVDVALQKGFRPERELRSLRRELPLTETAQVGWTDRFRPGQDEAEWLEVNNSAFVGHPENGNWNRKVLGHRMQQPWFDPDDIIVARRSGRMIGFCWTKRECPGVGEIYVIAVAPQHQGEGLGKALLMEGLAHLADKGAQSAVLYVDSSNHRALRLYNSVGFRLDHVDRSFVVDLVNRNGNHSSGSGRR